MVICPAYKIKYRRQSTPIRVDAESNSINPLLCFSFSPANKLPNSGIATPSRMTPNQKILPQKPLSALFIETNFCPPPKFQQQQKESQIYAQNLLRRNGCLACRLIEYKQVGQQYLMRFRKQGIMPAIPDYSTSDS